MILRKWGFVGLGIVVTTASGISWGAGRLRLPKPAYLLAAQSKGEPEKDEIKPAQTNTQPVRRLAFDVASIKPVAPPYPSGAGPWVVNHGRFKAQIASTRDVIAWANGLLRVQVIGGPDWLNRQLYEFDAESDNSDAGPPDIKVMLQTLLADRFKVALHHETQVMPVYTLLLGKNGSKMERMEGRQGRITINWTGPGRVTFTGGSMQGLINVLSGVLQSPVLDKTGLRGLYNFNLDFTDPRFLRPQSGPAGDSDPDLMTAVQVQLGLKLEMQKNPVEVVVIDHIETPSSN